MPFPTAPAPHVVAPDSVGRVMRIVLYALLPTVALQVVFFGVGLLVQITLGSMTALLAEALALKLRRKPLEPFLKDGSAIVTAVLLALCLPPLAPWWLVVSGTAFAILLAKHLYGGLGANPFNPAMVGYAVLLVSFPVQLLQWLPPAGVDIEHVRLTIGESITTILTGSLPPRLTWDAVTSPTPLDALRTNLTMGMTMAEARAAPIFGTLGGRGWEWINLATLGGGAGIELELATNTLVQGNESTGNAGGIELSGSSDNTIEASGGLVFAEGATGTLEFDDAGDVPGVIERLVIQGDSIETVELMQ